MCPTAVTSQLRRDATRVIFEILILSKSGPSKTHIIFKANLSFRLAEKYVHFLVEKKLLREEELRGPTHYFLTERGERFLRHLEEVEKQLADFFVKDVFTDTRLSPNGGTIVTNYRRSSPNPID